MTLVPRLAIEEIDRDGEAEHNHNHNSNGDRRAQREISPRCWRDDRYRELMALLVEYAQLQAGDPRRRELRDELVRGYLPVARQIARRYAHRGEALEDLTQVASLGLVLAIERFSVEIGEDFLAFAIPTIQGEVRKYFRDQGWAMRVPRRLKELRALISTTVSELGQQLGRAPRPSEIAQRLDLTEDEVLAGLEVGWAYRLRSLDEPVPSGAEDPETIGEQLGETDPGLEFIEDHNAVVPLLETLPERERTILMLRFYADMAQTQIAARLGLSQMHVSRLLAQTLGRLRRQLQAG
jgi:RNA polymerase sigma-B factor